MQQMPRHGKRVRAPPRRRTRRKRPRLSGAVVGTGIAVGVLVVLQFFAGAGWESVRVGIDSVEAEPHIDILHDSCNETGSSIFKSRGELADHGGSLVDHNEEHCALKCVHWHIGSYL